MLAVKEKPKIRLNSREEKIALALKKGIALEQICQQMKIGARTLDFYLTTLSLKLECRTVEELRERLRSGDKTMGSL